MAQGSYRTKSRRHALEILFEADLRDVDPLIVLADRTVVAEQYVRTYTSELVRGVHGYRRQIDTLISECLTREWTLARMPRVDRNLARIAVYEMAYTDIPHEVAISEAVSLGEELSTDQSPVFLNGLLSKVQQRLADDTAEM